MCHEWTRVWQCNHGATPQDAPTLALCTVGQLNLSHMAATEAAASKTEAAAKTQSQGSREAQLRAACAYIEDVRILQEGWCRRCCEERRRDPKAFEGRELCWKDEKPGTVM